MLTIENTDTVEYNGLSDGTANKKTNIVVVYNEGPVLR